MQAAPFLYPIIAALLNFVKGAFCFALPNKIGHGAAGILRVGDAGGLACLDAAEQPRHIAAKLLHHGAALFVLQDLGGVGAVDHGPVGAVDQRHVEELGVLDQLVKGGGGTGAAGRAADDPQNPPRPMTNFIR